MSNFRTKISPKKFPFEISHQDKLISIGSCFSENMGEKLKNLKFDISINPFGILFNPISIFTALDDIITQKKYAEKDLNNNQEVWFSFNHHSSYSGLNKTQVLAKINNSISENYKQIKETKVIFLTYGTSWVYKQKDSNRVVANCYKLPSAQFKKEISTISEISSKFDNLISKIKVLNPAIKFVHTISPVRHWKDGFVENQQSKSTLVLALKEMEEKYENCFYFPSYEIQLDDLRDYRFYEKDMLHPSSQAIDYIWNKLENCVFNSTTVDLNKRIIQLKTAVNHRSFNPKSEENINFKVNTLKQIVEIENEFGFNFSKERENLNQ